MQIWCTASQSHEFVRPALLATFGEDKMLSRYLWRTSGEFLHGFVVAGGDNASPGSLGLWPIGRLPQHFGAFELYPGMHSARGLGCRLHVRVRNSGRGRSVLWAELLFGGYQRSEGNASFEFILSVFDCFCIYSVFMVRAATSVGLQA